jgi:hypothetical protein
MTRILSPFSDVAVVAPLFERNYVMFRSFFRLKTGKRRDEGAGRPAGVGNPN